MALAASNGMPVSATSHRAAVVNVSGIAPVEALSAVAQTLLSVCNVGEGAQTEVSVLQAARTASRSARRSLTARDSSSLRAGASPSQKGMVGGAPLASATRTTPL